MKKKKPHRLPKIIYSITIRGHVVIFTEDYDGIIEYWLTDRISVELYDCITRYLLDEGIFEKIYGKGCIDKLLKDIDCRKND